MGKPKSSKNDPANRNKPQTARKRVLVYRNGKLRMEDAKDG